MINIQEVLNAQMSKIREERLSNSGQLLLGELILKIEAVKDKSKKIAFDFGALPAGACSWRGSYCELGLEYSDNGGGEYSWNTDEVTWTSKSGQYKSYKMDSDSIPENPTTQDFLDMLKKVVDKEMVGYKGGDYKMHKHVAVYFGNYGDSSVYHYKGKEYATVVPVDVTECDDIVIILTEEQDY